MSWTPPPGTIGLTHSHGLTGFRACIAHRLLGESAHYNHAFVVIGDGRTAIEPWPTGARVVDISSYGDRVTYGWLAGLSPARRDAIAAAAMSMDGIGYGATDYTALAAHRAGSRRRWVRRRVDSAHHMLPARFVVEAYWRAGVYLEPDRAPHEVTFGHLGELLLSSRAWDFHMPTYA